MFTTHNEFYAWQQPHIETTAEAVNKQKFFLLFPQE
jgi:hypothetical protein